MDCPKCDATALTEISMPIEDRRVPGPKPTFLTLEIDECPGCGGIWFDPGELDKYLDAKVKLTVPKATPKSAQELDARGGKCPRCAAALERKPDHYNPGVVFDVCGTCGGTWVDGDEVDRAGGDALPFADKMKALFGDVRPGAR